ncbi:hypothetical protein PC116_g9175 [Phytophthora cactorum]|uniref:Uncharacterized protein n=1 Tax=Phytophthora cactorum TaxID=29920 RepID=A0A8T0YEC1_9STRA|nr:hypothetical protein PC113_g19076 [Phytophthora cactorum]KAG2882725.1 hypothetical protein PC114_g20875 [Phytophthora cactorum]KAG3131420.1 hypothetical protein C6341_g23351 [Phytophthora cactorum]KAG3148995.1 hypothetical protein PC128_g23486 [Phytophthora cactorum]KAG4041757.1 hypothetical protein PC123_g22734 [Phytophthora cactorum]
MGVAREMQVLLSRARLATPAAVHFERGASAVKGPTKPPRAAGTNDGSNTLSSSADRPRPPLSALFSSLSFGSAVNWGRERSLTRRNPPAL